MKNRWNPIQLLVQGSLIFSLSLFLVVGFADINHAQEFTNDSAPAAQKLEPKDRMEPAPDGLDGVGVTEHLNAPLPLDLEFIDERGKKVKLGNFFQGNKPVILNLGYYRCPMLCGLILNGMLDALRPIEMMPGKEFEIVTLSIDPLETPELARFKKQNYIREYGKAEAAMGWHFLTGKESNIKELADAIGFEYKYNEAREEYAHSSAIMICTPDGRVSRYLYGIMYEPKTLRLSLVEASEGKIGTAMDQILLFCFHYDASAGRYAPMAMNIMRAGGAITMLVLISFLSVMWRREWFRKRLRSEGTQS